MDQTPHPSDCLSEQLGNISILYRSAATHPLVQPLSPAVGQSLAQYVYVRPTTLQLRDSIGFPKQDIEGEIIRLVNVDPEDTQE